MDAIAAAGIVEGYKDVKRFVNYFFNKAGLANALEDNYKRLKEEAGKLSARRNDIENDANRYKTKQFTEECKNWISRVKVQEKDVQELETEYINNYINRNRAVLFLKRNELSERMVNKYEDLHRIWLEGTFERGTLVEKPPECVITMPAPKTKDKPSLHRAVEEILGHLRDRNVRTVGLWGTVGVGKTTIMQNVNNNEDIAKMFDIVIWLTVSKDWSIEKLQRAITQRLKLKVEDFTNPGNVAQQISTVLECKKYLLLLDEVLQSFNLCAIGIYEDHKDGKVVLATRNSHICSAMDTGEEVKAQRLSKNDAYKMFLEKVGRRNVNLSSIESIAKLVVKECDCLPLLIEKVAAAFRSKKNNYELWNEGLSNLRIWNNTGVPGIDELIRLLRFCYDELGEDKKVCFLYGALYPEDCEICMDHLLECWKAEGFIDANKFILARQKGRTILHDLILRSMLEESDRMNYVRMNKVMRNMALLISSESNYFKVLVRTPQEQQQPPNEVQWQHANGISLMDNDQLCLLPEKPNCENLSTLFFQRNRSLEEIPGLFFELMQNLQVLDLHDTRITSLPSSISCLTCLIALYLNSCIRLTELPLDIEKLKCLEILDIRGTGINNLPIHIQLLIKLKCLRLSLPNAGTGQSSDVGFGKDVLSSLSLLEELRINVNQDIQELETVVKAITQEVASLEHLTSLSICFPGVNCLENFISIFSPWKNYVHFTFQSSVGPLDSTRYQILGYFEYQNRRYLKFVNGEGVHPAISKVLAKTDAFELIVHKGPSNLSDFGVDNINKMRGCLIEGCNEIETLVDGNIITKSALICLEEMHINDAANLTSIWEGVVHAGSLAQLKTLTLFKCLKLKKIFSNGMIGQLSNLQNLRVEKCPIIEEIIMESENRGLEPDALPNLKVLELFDLEAVKSIWIDDTMQWPSLEKFKMHNCPLLTRYPFNT